MSRRHDELTDADRALLERLSHGECGKRLADVLGIGVTGVTQRVKKIVKILRAKNRTNAVAIYLAPERYGPESIPAASPPAGLR